MFNCDRRIARSRISPRDIKPSNFAVGREGAIDRNVVYMLDFGLCRQYVDKSGVVKKPRDNTGFRGTVRYASLAAHECKDLCRRDDLWSLFYSFVEMITGQLPWRKTNDKQIVMQLKMKYPPDLLCHSFPMKVTEFWNEIKRLQFAEKPDYGKLRNCLVHYTHRNKVSLHDPYDWEMIDCKKMEHWKPPK